LTTKPTGGKLLPVVIVNGLGQTGFDLPHLKRLAAIKRDALGIFAHAHQRESEISLCFELFGVFLDECLADPERHACSEGRVA